MGSITPNPVSEVYTTAQGARLLGVSVATLRHHIYNTKKLAADFRAGNALFFKEETLRSFDEIRSQRRSPRKPKKEASETA